MGENSGSRLKNNFSNKSAGCPVVVCSTDEKFIMPTAVMLKSLIVNSKKYDKIKIFILCSCLKESHKNKILDSVRSEKADLEFLEVNKSDIGSFSTSKNLTLATYYRLLISSLLPDKIKKVIYLDTDLVVNEDIGKLWDVETGDKIFLAVQDQGKNTQYLSTYFAYGPFIRTFNPFSKHFNAGVMLINLERWRNEHVSERVIEFLRNHSDIDFIYDQEAMNLVLENEIGELDLRWNLQTWGVWNKSWKDCPVKSMQEYKLLMNHPFIVHFNAHSKPWKARCSHPYKDLFFYYLDMTEWKGWRPKLTLKDKLIERLAKIKRIFLKLSDKYACLTIKKDKPKFCFVFSDEVGMKTFAFNLKNSLGNNPLIDSEFNVVSYKKKDGLIENLPSFPGSSYVKKYLRMFYELFLKRIKGDFDASFIALRYPFPSLKNCIHNKPYFLTFDSTSKQFDLELRKEYDTMKKFFRFADSYKERQRKKFYNNAVALFPWSFWAAESLVRDYGVHPKKIFVVPPGVDVDIFRPVRKKENGKIKILFVGGDFHRKGGDLLLKWAEKTDLKGWELHLVTKEKLGVVPDDVFVHNGLSSNDAGLIDLYQSADLFVLPTRADCYSIAGIEAMSCGVPVILSKTGGTGDIIKPGETGFLIKPGSYEDIKEKLEFLISHPAVRKNMGLMAREDAVERFDASKNSKRILDIMLDSLKP